MKQGLRNTLILILTLLLIVGGGWYYLEFRYNPQIEDAIVELESTENELSVITDFSEMYANAQATYHDAVFVRENHPKELLLNSNTSLVYNYLQELNRAESFTELNFSFQDSVQFDDHGILNFELTGEGNYQNLVNFLYRIEHSRPFIKINSVLLQGISDAERLSRVNYSVQLSAYYQRGNWSEFTAHPETVTSPSGQVYNPYYPLIHSIPANENNLPDVENSRLIILTGTSAYIIDQNGDRKRLNVGDRVYLGRLSSINIEQVEAIFQLNRGGIVDRVILTLDQ